MPWTHTHAVPKWTRVDQLRSVVPWLSDSDFDEGRSPIWDVNAHDEDRASCWPIKLYRHGSSATVYLLMHAQRGNGNDGGIIALDASNTPRFDIYAQESFAIAQSNPQRQRWRGVNL